ncbi:hypothetical protein [Streptomyces fulvoviolaceus]|uniref:hypothetical protein n=1 Tax=Streptomyces fulvoviolaceus TaxID=285535 RepID=UPI0021C20DE0|nr:hypothetical protein [Streptomyces fulvoviolaceus]MCT9082600.1 hypothetical protein [Streptomyces fulvoviolaceus]
MRVHRELHGRGALFDRDPAGLAARLVGLRPHHHLATEIEHPRELPFVVLTCARGLGKTAVLGELRDAYQGHTPVALIDCEDDQFAAPPAGRPAEAWSPMGQALLVLAEQLAQPVTGAGRIQFPRLMTGLVAVAAGGWVGVGQQRIEREVQRILLLDERDSWLAGFAGKWAAKVAAKIAAAAIGNAGRVAAAIVEASLEALVESLVQRRQKQAANWWRDYPEARRNAGRGLLRVADHFRAGGQSRKDAERYLVRALLADLTEAYEGVMPRMRRLGRPLVLVDNAHGAPGPDLRDAVLRDRFEGIADRTVFITAQRGESRRALPNAVRRTLPDVARRSGWSPDPAARSSRALLVSLPPLNSDDTLHLVGAACAEVSAPPQLPYAIQRLTRGNPLGIVLLAESAAQNLPDTALLGELLTADLRLHEDRDGRPTYIELLDRLVPADRLDELTVLAAAHDHASAAALAEALLPDGFGPADVRALSTRLMEEGRPEVRGRFVGDSFVRTLLLLRLHHGVADHGLWREAHETLIRHYAPTGESAPSRARYRLHHELALGGTESAVAYLRDSFAVLETRTWLRTLRFVASAPYFHAHDAEGRDFAARDDRRAAIALGHTDAAQVVPDDVDAVLHLRVRRLLHAVWQLADPLVLPDPKVRDRLRYELEQLSNLRPAGNALLWQASRDWTEDGVPDDEGDDNGDDSDDGDGEA